MLLPRLLLPIYLLAVALIVFSPSDGGPGFLDWLSTQLTTWLGTQPGKFAYDALEFTANIAMFVPFGILVRLASTRMKWWMILALGFLTTVTIELTQLAVPGRFSTVSDVIANTLGTALGLAAITLVSRR